MNVRLSNSVEATPVQVASFLAAKLDAQLRAAAATTASVTSSLRMVRTPSRVTRTYDLSNGLVSSRNTLVVNLKDGSVSVTSRDTAEGQKIVTRLSVRASNQGSHVTINVVAPDRFAGRATAELLSYMRGFATAATIQNARASLLEI